MQKVESCVNIAEQHTYVQHTYLNRPPTQSECLWFLKQILKTFHIQPISISLSSPPPPSTPSKHAKFHVSGPDFFLRSVVLMQVIWLLRSIFINQGGGGTKVVTHTPFKIKQGKCWNRDLKLCCMNDLIGGCTFVFVIQINDYFRLIYFYLDFDFLQNVVFLIPWFSTDLCMIWGRGGYNTLF